jgi:hypothetical protein
MRAWQHSIGRAAFVAALSIGCRRGAAPSDAPPAAPAPSPAAPGAARAAAEALLDGVVDPWTWPRAAGATDRERAIEDIGPYERLRPGDPSSTLVSTNGHYWTALVGLPWDRDIDIDIADVPVDLDGDGRPDTTVTRHVHAKGGILANPELFGLTPTPDDPRGRIGRVSASTGVLGLREALRPDGTRSGEIGMTCWLCHGRDNPAAPGKVVLGLPGTAFDYGLLLATAAVLDDRDAAAVAYRRARGFPPGKTVRARLVLAGPGRQDLTGEFGLDVTVPGYHSSRYPGTARVRQGTRGLFNPISVPGILAAPGLALENWSGSEDSGAPWLARLAALARKPEAEAAIDFDLASGVRRGGRAGAALPLDRELVRRRLMFDLRNLGTLGLQQDSFPGLLWADAITGRVDLSPGALAAIPRMYAAAPVRTVLDAPFDRPAVDPARVARGRAIFAERVIGTIANRQILKRAPRPYAAARIEGPILAPIDATKPLDAKLAVRCADCHSAAPLAEVRPLAENPPPFGRCTHCHRAHPAIEEWRDDRRLHALPSVDPELVPLTAPGLRAGPDAATEVSGCAACHTQHRDFGPVVYSSGLLLPFDANGDGDAQLDPAADRRAGGIGTDPFLAFDVPRAQWPFFVMIPSVSDPARAGRVGEARVGMSWVRAAPLVGIAATAPYLHNGSVPTLRALLEPAAHRPARFPLGRAGFVLDTRLPGNGNQGHEFGTALTAAEKEDLLAFLQSL